MVIDPIVEQLHEQREEYMERFGYDFDAIIRDIKVREAANPGPLLKPPSEVTPPANRSWRGRPGSHRRSPPGDLDRVVILATEFGERACS